MTAMSTDEPIKFNLDNLLSDIRSRTSSDNSLEELDEYISEIKELVEAGLAQARDEAFDVARAALHEGYHQKREEFLRDCVLSAGEHDGYAPWLRIVEYDDGQDSHRDGGFKPASFTFVECEGDEDDDDLSHALSKPETKPGEKTEEDNPWYKVTHETIELGLRKIRNAVDIPDKGTGNWERNLTSVPHLHTFLRDEIVKADLTNGEADLDIIGYLAILEVALFDQVKYA